jgi:hypothetical protein
MEPVERYCSVLGIAPDMPAQEMERVYVSLLQELNSRQAAFAGDPEAQDALEQKVREVMEAYAYLARHQEVLSVHMQGRDEEGGRVPAEAESTTATEEGEQAPIEPEPLKLVSDRQLTLLFRCAAGLLICALLAILVTRWAARHAGPEPAGTESVVSSAPTAGQAVQGKVSTASGSAVERGEEVRQTGAPAARSRGRGVRHGDFPLKGRVLSITSGAEHSYLLVGLDRGRVWVAIPRTLAIRVGDRIESPDAPQVLNYHSSILERTVDRIIFPRAIMINGKVRDHGQAGG